MAPTLARKILLQHAAQLFGSSAEVHRDAAVRLMRDLAEDSEIYIRPHQMPAGEVFAMQERARAVSTAA
jgi:hypothetical protein